MIKSLAVLGCLTSSLVLAQTVPGSISFNARLTDTGGAPVTGSHTLAFSLFSQSTGGAAVWTETQAGATFSTEGVVYAELGSVTPLTPAALDGTKMFLEISVDGTTMTPRLGVVSVPYAIRASVAASALTIGNLTQTQIQTRVSGMCAAGQAIRTIDAAGGVTCETVAGSGGGVTSIVTPSGSGLSSSGTGAVTVGLATCANGEVLKSNGTSWACGTVGVTTGGGLTAGTGGTIGLQACPSGQTLVSNGTGWACASGSSGGGGSGGPSIVSWGSSTGAWNLVSGQAATITLSTTDSLEGDSAFDFFVPSGTTGAVYTYGAQIPIDTRVPHVGRISARYQTGGGTFSAGIEAYNAAGTSLGTRNFMANAIDLSTTGGGWQSYAGYIQGEGAGANQFPAGTRFVRPRIVVSANNIGLTRIDGLAIEPIVAIRRIARNTFNGEDQAENGVLAGRSVSLFKVASGTGVRVAWNDNFRVTGTGGNSCFWEVLFNGNACTSPGRIIYDKYSALNGQNSHDPVSVFGTCFATSAGPIGPGTVNITTRVGTPVPQHAAGDCYTGWAYQRSGGFGFIEAEEVL